MSADKNTIGVTQENREFLDEVISRGFFNDQIDAAKLGLSIAIRQGLPAGEASGVDTKWNVGSFDKDGHLRTLLGALYPDVATPYRLAVGRTRGATAGSARRASTCCGSRRSWCSPSLRRLGSSFSRRSRCDLARCESAPSCSLGALS